LKAAAVWLFVWSAVEQDPATCDFCAVAVASAERSSSPNCGRDFFPGRIYSG